MNERIRELAEQAWDHLIDEMGDVISEDGSLNSDFLHTYVQRFAELIVRECATAITDDELAKDCDTLMMQSWAKGMNYSAKLIKEHFGVEE